MQILVQLTGTSPLVCHNVRLADPADPITQAIKQITDKRTRTQADTDELERLEFLGGLYLEDGAGPVVPTWNIKRCFEEAAKATRSGKDLIRAAVPLELNTALLYAGPRDPGAMWADASFRWRTMIGVQRNKTVRIRPIFREWRIETEFELIPELMNLDEFERIVERAGLIEGLGDARKLGYGRFTAKVTS